jgi:hypothetical protein
MKSLQTFLSESRTSMKEFEKLVQLFLPYAFKELKLTSIPPIHFRIGTQNLHIQNVPGVSIIQNSGFSQTKGTFGQTSHKNRIVVNIKNRHPLDALRTLAHELAHYSQHLSGTYGSGETGSPTENQASARAAVIMRNFDYSHPNLFKLNPL